MVDGSWLAPSKSPPVGETFPTLKAPLSINAKGLIFGKSKVSPTGGDLEGAAAIL